MHLWLCGQVSTRWGFREEIVLGAGRKAEGWFNGFLLQTTSKISKVFFSFSVFFPLLTSVHPTVGLDLTLKCEFFGKWFKNWNYLRLSFFSFLCELQKHLFSLLLLLSPCLSTLEAQPEIQWNIMNQLLLASLINRDVLLENKTINKAVWANRINMCAQQGGTSLCLIHSQLHACRWSILMTLITLLISASYTVKHVYQQT